MCGIIGAISAKRDISPVLLEGLAALEYRGYDSAGLSVRDDDDRTHLVRSVGKVVELDKRYREELCTGRIGIAHTRWATHGKPSVTNAHPQRAGDLLVVCNGIVENHADLRAQLEQDGCTFASDTDTETLAMLVHQHTKKAGGDLLEGLQTALPMVRGSYSFVAMQEGIDRLVAVVSGCPLVLGIGDNEMFVASDPLALARQTDQFVFPEDGQIVVLEATSRLVLDREGKKQRSRVQKRNISPTQMDKGNYRHFTEKEIAEQPDVVRNTMAGRLSDENRIAQGSLGLSSKTLSRVKHVHLVACGSAHYAAQIGAFWLEKLAGLPCRTWVGSEYRYNPIAVPDNCLFIAVSQSGETADTLAALKRAEELGYLSRLAVCNVADSVMVRTSPNVLLTQAGREISVLSTKAVMGQIVALLMLALKASQQQGDEKARQAEALCKNLHELPAALEKVLALDGEIEKAAHLLVEYDHVIFLGRGGQYMIAEEGALKMKESAYIHAEAYPAGELKHGPLALVSENMPIVALLPREEYLADKMVANLQEIAARGGQLMLIGSESCCEQSVAPLGRMLVLPDTDPETGLMMDLVAVQLLAYHVARLCGTDVDQPRNLAKSVTVE